MKLVLSALAANDIEDSKNYYNGLQSNLGHRFKFDIQKIIDNIARFPDLYPNVAPDIKRVVLQRFPYCVYYAIAKNSIIILSVAHQHRKPQY